MLDQFVNSIDSLLAQCHVTVLVRGESRFRKLIDIYGDRIAPIIFEDLDDTDFLTNIASKHDIVVNAGTGFHAPSAKALVVGLAQGRNERGPKSWIIHLSGASNVAYGPLNERLSPEKRFLFRDDESTAILHQEMALEALDSYPQRTAELAVWAASEAMGVQAVVLQAPFVFGEGLPYFNAAPRGIAIMMQFILDKGYAFQLKAHDDQPEGGRIAIGHVVDVADFILLLLHEVVENSGQILLERRIKVVYPAVGMVETAVVARKCLDAAFRKGVLPQVNGSPKPEVKVVSLDEAAPYFGLGSYGKTVAALCWGRSVDTIGIVGRDLLGWKPKYLMEDWAADEHFDRELEAVLGGRRHSIVYRSVMTIPESLT